MFSELPIQAMALKEVVRPQRSVFLGMLQVGYAAEKGAGVVNHPLFTGQSFWWLKRGVLGTDSLVILKEFERNSF